MLDRSNKEGGGKDLLDDLQEVKNEVINYDIEKTDLSDWEKAKLKPYFITR